MVGFRNLECSNLLVVVIDSLMVGMYYEICSHIHYMTGSVWIYSYTCSLFALLPRSTLLCSSRIRETIRNMNTQSARAGLNMVQGSS